MTTTWLNRHQLPPYKKLSITFDHVRLLEEFNLFQSGKDFNAYDGEYKALFNNNTGINAVNNMSNSDTKLRYNTMPLTVFDSEFDLSQRQEHSNSLWDKKVVRNDPASDERFYRKIVQDIPSYTKSVLAAFSPHIHRTRFANLSAHQRIDEHVDYDTKYSVRLHIAIATNDRCTNSWRMPDGTISTVHIPADGSVWFVNQGIPHWAVNDSDTDRVHLIMSVDSQAVLDM